MENVCSRDRKAGTVGKTIPNFLKEAFAMAQLNEGTDKRGDGVGGNEPKKKKERKQHIDRVAKGGCWNTKKIHAKDLGT